MCRSPSPLDMCPSVSKVLLLRSAQDAPGVAGPQTPADWRLLRAWVCLDQGLNFLLKMRKRFMACSHESASCSLKLLPRWLLLSWEKIILSPPVSFFPFSSSSPFLTSHHLRFCADLFGDRPLTLALSLCSFPMFCFQSVPIPFSPPPLPSLFPLLNRTILFSFYTSSILPFQHMTDCVINVHHKPLFLLATH